MIFLYILFFLLSHLLCCTLLLLLITSFLHHANICYELPATLILSSLISVPLTFPAILFTNFVRQILLQNFQFFDFMILWIIISFQLFFLFFHVCRFEPFHHQYRLLPKPKSCISANAIVTRPLLLPLSQNCSAPRTICLTSLEMPAEPLEGLLPTVHYP